jgi:hypothetical protein
VALAAALAVQIQGKVALVLVVRVLLVKVLLVAQALH